MKSALQTGLCWSKRRLGGCHDEYYSALFTVVVVVAVLTNSLSVLAVISIVVNEVVQPAVQDRVPVNVSERNEV